MSGAKVVGLLEKLRQRLFVIEAYRGPDADLLVQARHEATEALTLARGESAERKRIAEGMRERCARYLDEIKKPGLADCIRALPLKTGGDDGNK